MSPRGGIAAPVIPINRLPSPLSTVSEQQRDAREEQQREYDLAEGCLVNPAEQLEAEPGSAEHAGQSHHKEFSRLRSDGSLRAKPDRAHQEDRNRDRLKHRALDVFRPAAQSAPDGDENAGQAREAAEYAVE